MSVNHIGSIDADKVYVEDEFMEILCISRPQLVEHFKNGLKFFRRTRKEKCHIVGRDWLRYCERNSQSWQSENENEAA